MTFQNTRTTEVVHRWRRQVLQPTKNTLAKQCWNIGRMPLLRKKRNNKSKGGAINQCAGGCLSAGEKQRGPLHTHTHTHAKRLKPEVVPQQRVAH
jgi:hypothetical protein